MKTERPDSPVEGGGEAREVGEEEEEAREVGEEEEEEEEEEVVVVVVELTLHLPAGCVFLPSLVKCHGWGCHCHGTKLFPRLRVPARLSLGAAVHMGPPRLCEEKGPMGGVPAVTGVLLAPPRMAREE
ncbi:unnamed protein product [Boreogadus saida]